MRAPRTSVKRKLSRASFESTKVAPPFQMLARDLVLDAEPAKKGTPRARGFADDDGRAPAARRRPPGARAGQQLASVAPDGPPRIATVRPGRFMGRNISDATGPSSRRFVRFGQAPRAMASLTRTSSPCAC